MSDDSSKATPMGGASSKAVRQAHEDLAVGRRWQARDVLLAHVAESRDEEALDLLGEVQHAMGDLPAAGAAWFGSRRKGAEVDEAVAAWRERHGDDFGRMWRSLPRSVRADPRLPRVEALKKRAHELGEPMVSTSKSSSPPLAANGFEPAVIIGIGLAVLAAVCAVVGAVTMLRWLVPG